MPNTTQHEVQAGETLSGIAGKNGVSLKALLAANPDITDPNSIRIGQVVSIPTTATSDVPEPAPDVGSPASPEPAPVATSANPNALLSLFEPAGASAKTAKQDKLPAGVASSEKMAQFDRSRVMKHKAKFQLAASMFHLPPALLAAIASRESRGGAVLDSNGEGDGGHGFGIMQVDDRSHSIARDDGPAGQSHINQATGILQSTLKTVTQKFPGLSEVEQLEMAVSRYNGGKGLKPPNSDTGTTGGDYMNDVWARARFYARVENWT